MSLPLVLLILSLLLCQQGVVAEPAAALSTADVRAAVDTALETLDATILDDDWSFTMKVVEEDELRVIHSDPRRGKYAKRQLLSVNGAAPDKAQQAAFYDAEVERIDGIDPDAQGYSALVDRETLQLLETGDDHARFSFVPTVKALEDSRDKVSGFLLLNLASRQIDQIEILNTEPLTPAFSVTVDTYRLTMQFEREQGEILLSKLESQAAGTVGFLKSFDSQVVISFSDFQRASP